LVYDDLLKTQARSMKYIQQFVTKSNKQKFMKFKETCAESLQGKNVLDIIYFHSTVSGSGQKLMEYLKQNNDNLIGYDGKKLPKIDVITLEMQTKSYDLPTINSSMLSKKQRKLTTTYILDNLQNNQNNVNFKKFVEIAQQGLGEIRKKLPQDKNEKLTDEQEDIRLIYIYRQQGFVLNLDLLNNNCYGLLDTLLTFQYDFPQENIPTKSASESSKRKGKKRAK
jgi:hypothetical protein